LAVTHSVMGIAQKCQKMLLVNVAVSPFAVALIQTLNHLLFLLLVDVGLDYPEDQFSLDSVLLIPIDFEGWSCSRALERAVSHFFQNKYISASLNLPLNLKENMDFPIDSKSNCSHQLLSLF
jgi:hypothetical protein